MDIDPVLLALSRRLQRVIHVYYPNLKGVYPVTSKIRLKVAVVVLAVAQESTMPRAVKKPRVDIHRTADVDPAVFATSDTVDPRKNLIRAFHGVGHEFIEA